MIPEVFASRAPHTSFDRLGSRARACSPERSSSPSTPFSRPRSWSSRSLGSSSSRRQTTKAPTRRKGMSSSSESLSIIRLPRTFILAFKEPGWASNPA